jgi:YhcH/YjgK/YiaL family protein
VINGGIDVIIDTLNNIKFYKELLPQLLDVEKFILAYKNKIEVECGKYLIDNENIFALIQKYLTRDSKDNKWETHQEYIDVQFVLRGEESIGYAPIKDLVLTEDFTEGNDIAFYKAPENYTNTVLSQGMFAIFYPEEGHLPCCISKTASNVIKIVFKIKKT